MLRQFTFIGVNFILFVAMLSPARGDESNEPIEKALSLAGDNRAQIEKALADVPEKQRESMRFLVAHMPDNDLKSLTADYLLENVRLAHQAFENAPWREAVPREVFLNDVLPYASINEKRDDWRRDFSERFAPLIEGAKSPGQAAALLNQKVFPLVKVRYSTGRKKADQSALETIETGTASCTGLSVLLIDACRAVGVPARFVGTPLWADGSGNHSWVEVWDEGWHFTGAAEPSGDKLDDAWFIGRASAAKRDDPRHAVYASSFRRTPRHFPLVWDIANETVPAVNVTDRYTRLAEKLPEGVVRVMFRVVDGEGRRVAAKLTISDAAGEVVFEGQSNDERFDANDHRTVPLKLGQEYALLAGSGDKAIRQALTPGKADELVTVVVAGRE